MFVKTIPLKVRPRDFYCMRSRLLFVAFSYVTQNENLFSCGKAKTNPLLTLRLNFRLIIDDAFCYYYD